MDPFVDLKSSMVGAAIAVSTIFLPFFAITGDIRWKQTQGLTITSPALLGHIEMIAP